MENVKSFLTRIRKPDKSTPRHIQILVSIGIAMAGFALGVLQKWLDSGAVNELPVILQRIDIGNYFGRFAIWILLGTVISVYARTPIRAAINTFLFFICMVAGYYLYCHYVLGFLPRTYMMVWVIFSLVSPILAFICWYAKGEEYERRLDEAAATTKLPDNPDMEKVEKFVERINRIAVNEEF